MVVTKLKRHHPLSVRSACRYLVRHLSTRASKPKPAVSSSSSLQALTVAALALPGLVLPAAYAAEEDEVNFQYGHYQEGKRNLYNVPNDKNPIEVDSLFGRAKVSLSDRIKFAFNYTQDTWSGATPITTAPLVFGGNRAYKADTPSGTIIAGASPYLNGQILLNKNFIPLGKDANGNVTGENTQLVHTLSTASPETRKQGDFKLGYEWDEAALDIGGGISVENDYESRFGNINGRWDFNQKLTSLNLGLSYTNSSTSATLDHDAQPYINTTAFSDQIELSGLLKILHGKREDWATSLGLTQILNKDALVEASIGYTRSTGYMANPYKAMTIVFVDPDQHTETLVGNVQAFLEQRPDQRNQLNIGSRYIQHIGMLDAALHLDYRFFHDDWGINAHTFEADWVQPVGTTWTVTPRVRYYSQDAADFYSPYLISNQAFLKPIFDLATDTFSLVNFDPKKLPANFSSDQRLSAFGALSGGVTVNKQFSKAVSLEAGFEYYTHAGSLKIGGGGEGSYSDFNYYQANAALKVSLSALDSGGHGGHSGHVDHSHHSSHGPAGVMFDHMLSKTNDMMVGYRFMYSHESGDILHGSNAASDKDIVNNGCGSVRCRLTPTFMNMSMHMLDIMYAPTDWLNLMLMPQFVDMEMNLRTLDGAPPVEPGGHIHTGTGHATGGVGDTGMYALVKLFDMPMHHVHLSLGVSAPTGDVSIKLRRTHKQDEGFIHYGMQLGSGTWDFKPSLTYTGKLDDWSWGAQLSGTKRLEDKNESGYALGDIFQSTAWGGYSLTRWLSASIRGVYTVQGAVNGQFNPTPGVVNGKLVDNVNSKSGTMDFPPNHGGRYWDIGFGLNAVVTGGALAGNSFGFEWLQPVSTDVNGYQLDRVGALSATWSLAF
ncbi:MAG: DUF3570 domain-containing protein [Methylobacter sp.]|nr:DUF3570 domain-containing protein [Methylobacter sp.]